MTLLPYIASYKASDLTALRLLLRMIRKFYDVIIKSFFLILDVSCNYITNVYNDIFNLLKNQAMKNVFF